MDALHGKTAIVTGCATETGQAAALALAQAGAAVVVCSAVQEQNDALVARLTGQGASATAVTADFSDEAGADQLVRQALAAFGQVDMLVLISAVWGGGAIHEHNVATWDRVMALNLRAPFLLARAVLPHMRKQGSGHVINIGGESGLQVYAQDGAYGVSLHALNALMTEIQLENESAGIRVDNLCTGLVVSAGASDGLYAEDVARWVVWLATQRPGLATPNPILLRGQLPKSES